MAQEPLPNPLPTYFHLHLISDATGETLTVFAKGAAVQFAGSRPIEHIHPLVRTPNQLKRVLREIEQAPGIVLYTIVKKELASMLKQACEDMGVPSVAVLDAISETMEAYLNTTNPPKVPPQGLGPHFTLRNGRLEFAPPQELDQLGNHLPTLQRMHPLLKELAADLVEALSGGRRGNIAHSHLHALAQKYNDVVSRDLPEISFAQLFGYGLRLQNAAAAAARAIGDRELPELDDAQRETLDSLLSLHGPFMLATKEGRELIDAAERFKRTPGEERAFQSAAVDLSEKLQGRTDIAEPETAAFVQQAAEAALTGEQTERSIVYSLGTVRNAAIVLCSGAIIACAAAVATSGGVIAAVVGGAAGLAIVEGTKKSKAFRSLSDPIAKRLDKLTETELHQLSQQQFSRLALFVLQNETILRRLAGSRGELRWVHQILDWLKQEQEKGSIRPSSEQE